MYETKNFKQLKEVQMNKLFHEQMEIQKVLVKILRIDIKDI